MFNTKLEDKVNDLTNRIDSLFNILKDIDQTVYGKSEYNTYFKSETKVDGLYNKVNNLENKYLALNYENEKLRKQIEYLQKEVLKNKQVINEVVDFVYNEE